MSDAHWFRAVDPRSRGLRGYGLLALLIAVLSAGQIAAVELTVRGETLDGKVVGVTKDGVEFETVYGTGTIVVPFADVEALHSEARFVVLYGDDGLARGHVLGTRDGALLIGDDPATATAVPADSILRSLTEADYDGSGLSSARAHWRHWRANFDFGMAITQATTDTSGANLALEVERRKAPTRLLLTGGWRYSTEKQTGPGLSRNTIENEARGLLRGEYDITERIFGFGSVSAEYDEIESLRMRSVPKAGLGYRIWVGEKGFFAVDAGAGYVYQHFFSGPAFVPRQTEENYWTASLGSELEYLLPYGARFTARGEYLPSLQDTSNYLARGSAALTFPVLSWVGLKLTIFDEYNNQPAAGSTRNTLTFTAGLSLLF